MISDVLSDAVGEIEDYEREFQDTYAEIAAEITVVKTVMDGLRIVFDAVPGQPAEYEMLIAELRSAILALDISGLVAARERLLAWVVEERLRRDGRKGA
jgi:hypothetical protein